MLISEEKKLVRGLLRWSERAVYKQFKYKCHCYGEPRIGIFHRCRGHDAVLRSFKNNISSALPAADRYQRVRVETGAAIQCSGDKIHRTH